MNNELNFNFGMDNTASQGKNQVRFTAKLNDVSGQRALEALRIASKDANLFKMANDALDSGDANQLFKFLEQAVGNNLETDVHILDGATEKEFDSMLESRRSDRSKTKKKGLKSSVAIATKYFETGYAEMIVRAAWNKPYDAAQSNVELDESDVDAINRKIKSLQSKKSRLNRLVELGDPTAMKEFEAVEQEISRLSSFRPNSRTTGKAVIKDLDTDLIRAALTQVDKSGLDEEQLAKLDALMKKLG